MNIETIMNLSPVIPVLVIDDADLAVPLAQALVSGGVTVLEVTLRTPQSLAAIRAIATHVPKACVGAGTVLNDKDLQDSIDAGAQFAVSPGSTPQLLTAATAKKIPLLPGIATASELMTGLSLGYNAFKFFPAESAGGNCYEGRLAANRNFGEGSRDHVVANAIVPSFYWRVTRLRSGEPCCPADFRAQCRSRPTSPAQRPALRR